MLRGYFVSARLKQLYQLSVEALCQRLVHMAWCGEAFVVTVTVCRDATGAMGEKGKAYMCVASVARRQ